MKQLTNVVGLFGLLMFSGIGHSGELRIDVRDIADVPLADAVIAAYPLHGGSDAEASAPAEMRQLEQRFDPHLLIVRKGADISFPNLDRTRHHVYSFSEARRFELKLYLGQPAAPVRFDTPGIVTLGCNIHDWMLGYVVVVDTPHFAKSGQDGRLNLRLPAGEYRIWVWHPRMPETESALDETIVVGEDTLFDRVLRPPLGPAPDLNPPAPLGLRKPDARE